jgi:succinate dehydrogenase / fumarate reductase, flavoprotein subunit
VADSFTGEKIGMRKEPFEWNVVQSDVLVVGGGFGGLWAALRASECGSSVVLVDKSFAGKSGHSYFASGARMVLLPEDSPDEYVREITLGNEWLIEQDMVRAIFEGSYERLKELESFGLIFRKEKGSYTWTRARGTQNVKNLWLQQSTAADEVTILRKKAISNGVKFLDHVYVYDLLKSGDNAVAGAIGIGVKEPRNYLFKAGSVVLATNSGSYRGHHLACELQGTGPFLAYDAGARVKNPEFHYINIRPVRHELEGSGILPAMGARWLNGKGAHFMETYDPLLKDRAPSSKIVMAAAKEAMKGNAPITIDVRSMADEERERFRLLMVSHGWQPILDEKCKREEGYDILRDNVEWQPAYESNKLGIDADLECESTLPGLFAAGMARTLGINPFTGWSIAACTWSGYTAGENASRHAMRDGVNSKYAALDFGAADDRRRMFLEPQNRGSGLDPDDLVRKLQEILFPVDVLIIMSEPGLKDALGQVLTLKEEQLPQLKAKETRSLIKAKETQTMVLSAEMALRAALMRKETRENVFYREDFPGRDDAHWLKWIIAQKGNDGQIEFSTREIPFEIYNFRPDVSAKPQEIA